MSDSSYAVSSGPSMSMMDNRKGNIGVGNYKGVMLCNRPFGGTTGTIKQAGTETGAFTCGVISEAVGVNVTISSKDKHKIERPKKDSVISKHRKWLADLQKQKDVLETMYISEMAQKKEAHDKFSDQESKLRKLAKSLYSDESEQKQLTSDTASIFNAESKSVHFKAESKSSSAAATAPFSQSKSSQGVKSSAAGSSRPAWALTETAAVTATEEKELDDEEELLSFAAGLDFNQLIGDMEVRTVMDRLRQRIAEMEKEVALEEQREGAIEVRAAKREQLAQMIDEALSLGVQEEKSEQDKNAAAARSVLQSQEGEALNAVHSNRSVTALIKSSRDKLQGDVTPKVLYHPIVVVHTDDDGARLAKHSAVANLPYMHRNPAV